MASNALNGHLDPLLDDADHLNKAIQQLPFGVSGRPARVAALNRAVVVACVSAWEAYIEEIVRESLTLLRPPAPPLGVWPALNATVRGQLGRFNTPDFFRRLGRCTDRAVRDHFVRVLATANPWPL